MQAHPVVQKGGYCSIFDWVNIYPVDSTIGNFPANILESYLCAVDSIFKNQYLNNQGLYKSQVEYILCINSRM